MKCPNCGYCTEPEIEQTNTLDQLREFCAENNIIVSGNGSVSENSAARILDRAATTLKNWRSTGVELSYMKDKRGRIRYSLRALAKFSIGDNEE